MKKLIAFLLAVIVILALALCSGRACDCDAEIAESDRLQLAAIIDGGAA